MLDHAQMSRYIAIIRLHPRLLIRGGSCDLRIQERAATCRIASVSPPTPLLSFLQSLSHHSSSMTTHSILFVCLGNICRSPLAEGVFAHLVDELPASDKTWRIESAGTAGYHVGSQPDER